MKLDHPNIIKTLHWFKEYFDKNSEYESINCVKYCIIVEYEEFDQFETLYHKIMQPEGTLKVILILFVNIFRDLWTFYW